MKRCESPTGGYGGGPMHEAHLAATYAAVSALVTIGNDVAFKSVNVKGVEQFLKRMQQPDGSFTVHDSGEIDIRFLIYDLFNFSKLILFNVEEPIVRYLWQNY